jgi:glutamate N-acetyltransferase/amino-acid N-acetyltransferase
MPSKSLAISRLPKGYKVGGIHSGLHKVKGKKDLALFISEVPANAAGMFTRSVTKAAPVIIDIERMKRNGKTSGKFSAIVANSGCANACTGKKGALDAKEMCALTEKTFNLKEGAALCASTGVIGQYLKMSAFRNGIKEIKNSVGTSARNQADAVCAIMTTDTFIKIKSAKIKAAKGEIKIWGCAKGAGMIHPDLQGLHATMLSFILTDACIDSKTLEKLLENTAAQSYNCVSVDGDTSTNDTLILMANGKSETGKLSPADMKKFAAALDEVTLSLAKQMAKDGEGATKFVEIEVRGAKTKKDAGTIASAVATSPLFKTAVFGADANWGRVIAAAGRAGVNFNPEKTDIYMGGFLTSKNGMAVKFSESKAKKSLLKKEVKVIIDLKAGKESSKYYTCDFSYDYVKINGDYRS